MRKSVETGERNTKRLPALQHVLVGLFVVAWSIPIILFSIYVHSYQNAYIERSNHLVENAISISQVMIQNDLTSAVEKSRKPIKETKWESWRKEKERGSISYNELIHKIRAYMISNYYMDQQFSRCAYYAPGSAKPTCYAGKNGYAYEAYMKYANPVVQAKNTWKKKDVVIKVVDNQLYVMRQLYTSKDKTFLGTVVLGIDTGKLVEDFPLDTVENLRVQIGEDTLRISTTSDEKMGAMYARLSTYAGDEKVTINGNNGPATSYVGFRSAKTQKPVELSLLYLAENKQVYAGVNRMNLLLVLVLAGMVPIIVFSYYYLRKQIQKPLNELTEVSGEIEAGRFGTTVEMEHMPNREFSGLAHSLNDMSNQVQYLFQTVYQEKVARRDAQIAALQAQINPHFLNNTLEMMNWQARMNGDLDTCKMIEALSTVLDSSMNRSDDQLVRLADEIHSADSFLYIMSMRFGKRLTVVKEIDETLLQVMVPGLILQPLIENAIRHGIERVSAGTVWLRIYRQENEDTVDELIIDVINSGKTLTYQEEHHIEDIISGKEKLKKHEPGSHTSIGIYNVNKRIQLIFGEEYGLKVTALGEDRVQSRIRIPLEY